MRLHPDDEVLVKLREGVGSLRKAAGQAHWHARSDRHPKMNGSPFPALLLTCPSLQYRRLVRTALNYRQQTVRRVATTGGGRAASIGPF
jgi:hypothetical protein